MRLIIKGVDSEFTAHKVTFEGDVLTIVNSDLEMFIKGLQENQKVEEVVEIIAPPPAPVMEVPVEYEPTELMGNHTMEAYEAAHWTKEAMLKKGVIRIKEPTVVVVPKEDLIPTAPRLDVLAPPPALDIPAPALETITPEELEIPAAPADGHTIVDGLQYKLSVLAKGNTLDDFYKIGYSNDQLVKNGYLEVVTAPVKDIWPIKNSNGEFVDSTSTVFDLNKHSLGKNEIPPVTTKGVFKKSRRKAAAVAPPPPPPAAIPQGMSVVPAGVDIPPPIDISPALDIPAPPVVEAKESVTPELLSILDDWGTQP